MIGIQHDDQEKKFKKPVSLAFSVDLLIFVPGCLAVVCAYANDAVFLMH